MWSYCGETPQTWKSYLSGGERTRDLVYLLLEMTRKNCLGRTIYSPLFSGTEDLSIFFFPRRRENSFLSPEQKGWMYWGTEDLSPSLSFLGRENTNFCSKNRKHECVPEDLSPFLSPLSISFFLRKRESSVGREGAKTPSPFLERALHSSEGRDSYPFLSCSNGEETVSSSLPRKMYTPSFLFRAEEIMSLV